MSSPEFPTDGPEFSADGTDFPTDRTDLPTNHAEFPTEPESAMPAGSREDGKRRRDIPDNLWMQCPDCSRLIYKPTVAEKMNVCPECNYHFEISSSERILSMLDDESFEEHFTELRPVDPLSFRALKAYKDRLAAAQARTGLADACIVGTGEISRQRVVFGVSDSRFLRGSMGSVVGEKIFRGVELARKLRVPFVFVSGSGGGARMDEGIFSLMQMAKTSAALAAFDREDGFFISILTNPTMGGAMASFAALGDVVFAEPKALIGFAGPNVIRQTIKSDIPEGFQTSEFLLEHGFVDQIVNREDLRAKVSYFLGMLVG